MRCCAIKPCHHCSLKLSLSLVSYYGLLDVSPRPVIGVYSRASELVKCVMDVSSRNIRWSVGCIPKPGLSDLW